LIRAIHDAQERYKMANGKYSLTLEDLDIEIGSSTKNWDISILKGLYFQNCCSGIHIYCNRGWNICCRLQKRQ